MEEALKFSSDAGYSNVFLWTAKALATAMKLYESFGFKETQEETHKTWGAIVTEARYELSLK